MWLLTFSSLALLAIAKSETLPQISVTNTEISNLVKNLRSKDTNKAQSTQIRLSYQGHTNSRSNVDNAANKLFSYVDPALLRKDTYTKLIALLNNYNRQTGQAENTDATEQREEREFLDAVLRTNVMKEVYKFLKIKRHPYANSEATFKTRLQKLWFGRYSRARGVADTSGFEHVFVGEVKNGQIGGLHNWVRFYKLESDSSARTDYKGFLVKRYNLLAAVKYSWQNEMKGSGTFMIGTSPEFDFAVYTLCFLTSSRGQCSFELDGCPVSVTSHVISQQGKVFIGSAYPSAGRMSDTCRRNGYNRRRHN